MFGNDISTRHVRCTVSQVRSIVLVPSAAFGFFEIREVLVYACSIRQAAEMLLWDCQSCSLVGQGTGRGRAEGLGMGVRR